MEDVDETEVDDDGSMDTLFRDFDSLFDNFLGLEVDSPLPSLVCSTSAFPFISLDDRLIVDFEYCMFVSFSTTPTLCFLILEALIKLTKRFKREKGVLLARKGAETELSEDDVT